jgi:hypothetical protein
MGVSGVSLPERRCSQGRGASEVAGCLSAEWAIDWHRVEQWSLPVGQLPECAGGVRNRSYL